MTEEEIIAIHLFAEQSETFIITPSLRWVDNSEYGKCFMTPKLQQLWQGSNGTQNWQDVPTVREG